ncbi:RhoGEF domain-containing protein [Anopheles sinensis]|uniref:RhoGEF domain-containing protein n=1 Tax=Anopheles sinensis TaxID=74873 RepID=A0A084W1J7_ANOSI|nr:RhoGEF domain-containing protein [Anopheles sinensis]
MDQEVGGVYLRRGWRCIEGIRSSRRRSATSLVLMELLLALLDWQMFTLSLLPALAFPLKNVRNRIPRSKLSRSYQRPSHDGVMHRDVGEHDMVELRAWTQDPKRLYLPALFLSILIPAA